MPRLLCLLLCSLFSQVLFASDKKEIAYSPAPAAYHFAVLSLTETFSIDPPADDSATTAKLRRKGKWVKWLGIGSLVGILVPVVGVLSLPAAIVALIMGGSVKRHTGDTGILKDVATGRKTAIATIVLNILFAVVVVVVVLALLRAWR